MSAKLSQGVAFLKKISNSGGLQIIQILRFTTFLLISVIFTKSPISVADIGYFELSLFIASAVSFFWVNGLIQSLLPLYHSNRTFKVLAVNKKSKSPELFNAFLLLTAFSILAFVFCLLFQRAFYLFEGVKEISFMNLIFIYILVSNPGHLIEYIYLLKNKPADIIIYGFLTFGIQLVIVTVPVVLGYSMEYAVWGLIAISVLRLLWLAVLLRRHARFRLSVPFIREHISLGLPLILSSLLSGSAQYVDGIIISSTYDAASFALFRFGAKEFPLAILMANGLSNAMLPEFSTKDKIQNAFLTIKEKSKRLMHLLFPLSILLLFFSKVIYINLFSEEFSRSADVFMVYLLLIISRLVFPQTILIGLKKTRIVLAASLIEIVLNVSLSLYLVRFYGIVGVAVATSVIFLVEKIVLIGYNYFQLRIKPQQYIPLGVYFFYSAILIILFILIDHRIILLR
ncbi:MAG: polysaccharide biosynthesis C-terminal domain-containing protein [Bacteroidales bacterium]